MTVKTVTVKDASGALVAVPLPTWTDATSIFTAATAVINEVVAVVSLVHPGFTEPTALHTWLPIICQVIAATAIIVNGVTHRSSVKAILNKLVG